MDNVPIIGGDKTEGKLTGMIGIARRAGRLTFGFDAVIKDVEAGKAKAVLLSSDASPRTAAKINEVCERRRTKFAVLPVSKALLGRAIGRDDVAVVSIGDKLIAGKILEITSAGKQKKPDGQINSGG